MKIQTKKHHQRQQPRNEKPIIRIVAKIFTPSFESVNYRFLSKIKKTRIQTVLVRTTKLYRKKTIYCPIIFRELTQLQAKYSVHYLKIYVRIFSMLYHICFKRMLSLTRILDTKSALHRKKTLSCKISKIHKGNILTQSTCGSRGSGPPTNHKI